MCMESRYTGTKRERERSERNLCGPGGLAQNGGRQTRGGRKVFAGIGRIGEKTHEQSNFLAGNPYFGILDFGFVCVRIKAAGTLDGGRNGRKEIWSLRVHRPSG